MKKTCNKSKCGVIFLDSQHKKVKYTNLELPQSEDTASPHSQEEAKERAWLIK
jgi:hypothetical protein